jgi:hypothetical protein
MDTWWSLGESVGFRGQELALFRMRCPFCPQKGKFESVAHLEKQEPNGNKKLNYETFKCSNCGNYFFCFWSAGDKLHSSHTLPWPLNRFDNYPDSWPETVGRYWLQMKRSMAENNWDAAALMARSALQAALRAHKAVGRNLKEEILDLAKQGILPPVIKEWSDNVRELGNDSAHPRADQAATAPQDARDIAKFLDFLLQYLFTLPHEISEYRDRKK